MKNSKETIWTNEALTIAYYFAKYDDGQLKMDEDYIVDFVIPNTSKASLKMQTMNFRELLEVDGPKLSHISAKQREVADMLSNLTVTQVRKRIFDYCDTMEVQIEQAKVKKQNKTAATKTKELNDVLNSNFERKLKAMAQMGRKLTPLKK